MKKQNRGAMCTRERTRLRGKPWGGREAWCVHGAAKAKGQETLIAAAADEREISLLELQHNASREQFLTREELLHFGADPNFRPETRARYSCDSEGCSEMNCKCHKY